MLKQREKVTKTYTRYIHTHTQASNHFHKNWLHFAHLLVNTKAHKLRCSCQQEQGHAFVLLAHERGHLITQHAVTWVFVKLLLQPQQVFPDQVLRCGLWESLECNDLLLLDSSGLGKHAQNDADVGRERARRQPAQFGCIELVNAVDHKHKAVVGASRCRE